MAHGDTAADRGPQAHGLAGSVKHSYYFPLAQLARGCLSRSSYSSQQSHSLPLDGKSPALFNWGGRPSFIIGGG